MTERVDVETIISVMDEIESRASKLKKPEIPPQALKRLMDVSKVTTSQPKWVTPKPLGWNLLEVYGHPHKQPLSVDAPLTKGEEVFYAETLERCKTLFGAPRSEYDLNAPIDDISHYAVDNFRNLKQNMRDQVPDQAQQRAQSFEEYTIPKPNVGIRDKLRTDPLFVKAIGMVLEVLPQIHATRDIVEASGPFMNKHTNLGYVDEAASGFNDRTIIPGTGLTGAEYCRRIAENIMANENWEDLLSQFDVWVALGKNKNGKGRAVEASSRPNSLCINQIEHPEIEACKKRSPPFAGYRDPKGLKQAMSEMCDDCKKKDLWATNWDQSGYDRHVSPDMISLVGALAVLKSNGERTKRLAIMRSVMALHGWLINGMTGTVEEIFGRIFSGYIDTNLSGSKINLIISLFVLMVIVPNYSEIWYEMLYVMLVMGDDNLQVRPKSLAHDKYVKAMKDIWNMEINAKKGEEGIFFLQRRLFTPPGYDHYVFVAPATRVIKSLMFGENPAPLGKFGWVLANLQLLDSVREYPPALDLVVASCYPYDKMRLGLGCTAEMLAKAVNLEDKLASRDKKGRRSRNANGRNNNMSAERAKRSVRRTADVIYDGDPTKEQLFTEINGEPVLNTGFVQTVLDAVAESINRVQPKSLVEPYNPAQLITEMEQSLREASKVMPGQPILPYSLEEFLAEVGESHESPE